MVLEKQTLGIHNDWAPCFKSFENWILNIWNIHLSIYNNKNECYVNNKVIEDEIHPDRMIDIVDICIDADEVLFILIILHKMQHTRYKIGSGNFDVLSRFHLFCLFYAPGPYRLFGKNLSDFAKIDYNKKVSW